MKIRKVEMPFLPCKRSTLIECSGVDKKTAEGITLLLGYSVEYFSNGLEFLSNNDVMGSLLEKNGDMFLFIDEGSEEETKYLSLGGENWIKKALTNV